MSFQYQFVPQQQYCHQEIRSFGKEIQNLPSQSQKINKKQNLVNKNIEFENEELNNQKSLQNSQSTTIDEEVHSEDSDVSSQLQSLIQIQNQNPQMVQPYQNSIFQYLDDQEIKLIAPPNYMENFQQEINPNMRSILIDWIIEIHLAFKLSIDTLYLTINLIDRYLSQNKVTRDYLQLVGVSALFIASKYEEIHPPDIKEFIYVCDKAYTKKEILFMEGQILISIDFKLNYISPIRFLQKMILCQEESKSSDIFESREYHLAQYILELSLYSYQSLQYPPSLLAAGAFYLSKKMLQLPSYMECSYQKETIKQSAIHFLDLHRQVNGVQQKIPTVKRKYTIKKYNMVSLIEIPSY